MAPGAPSSGSDGRRRILGPVVTWRCPFQIIGVGDEAVHEAFGVDAVQALQLCLQMIDIHLFEQRRAHTVTWLGSEDLGFFPIVNFAEPMDDGE